MKIIHLNNAGEIMNCKKIKIVMLAIALQLFSVFSVGAAKVEEYTFKEIVDLVLLRNSKVHQYQEKLLSKRYDQRASMSTFVPVVSIQGSFTRIKEPLTMDLNPIRDAMIALEANGQVQHLSLKSQAAGGREIQSGTALYNNYYTAAKAELETILPFFIDTLKEQQYPSASILVVQPLFTGLRITAAARAAKADRQATQYDLERIKNDLTKEAIQQCLNLIITKDLIEIRRSVLSGMEQHLQKARVLSEQGMIAKYHLLRAKVAVAEAERNLISDQNRYALVQLAIKNYSMIEDSITIEMKNSMVYVPIKDSIDKFCKMAENNQPALFMLKKNKEMARQKLIAMKGNLYPQINAYGKWELFKDYLSALEPQWAAGIQANFTLFNGGKNMSSILSAAHLTKEIDQAEITLKHDIKMWINKAYLDMKSADSKYVQLGTDLDLAIENLHQCQSRFESGYGTSLEVIDAALVLERNKVDRLAALGDYYKAITELYTAAGIPSEAIQYIIGEKNR